MTSADETTRSAFRLSVFAFGGLTAAFILIAGYLVLADGQYRAVRLLNSAYRIISLVASEAPGADSLALAAADGMVSLLGPYSQYLPPKRWEIMIEETEGVYCGIGVEMVILEGVVTIVSPIQGSPAHRAGIRAGDRIIKIDGKSARGITSIEAADRIRGPRDSIVVLGVERPGQDRLLVFELARDEVMIRPVSVAGVTPGGIGYVRLTRFSAGAAEMLDSILNTFITGGSTGWILDLRGNPGGLLDEAAAVAGCFLPEGTTVCETRGRHRLTSFSSYSVGEPISADIPIIVLIDEGSASASEIVAAAIADHQRGVIVGRRSFGKGLVQSFFSLGDRHALQLTTGRYFTPGGYSFYHPHDEPEEDQTTVDDSGDCEGGLTPHLIVENATPSMVEGELMQSGAFLNSIAVHADSLERVSFGALWEDFSAEIRGAKIQYVTRLEYAFAVAESAATYSLAAADWERVFADLKSPLEIDRAAELAGAEPQIKMRLAESAVLFGGDQGIRYLPQYLELDMDTKMAVEILGDSARYRNLLANPPAQNRPSSKTGDQI
jgi:carboxyl-terminal processing protease